MTVIKTERLILPSWEDKDLEPFAALNANPKVMEYFPATHTQNMRSRRVMKRIGMQHDPKDDFEDPKLPEGHRLRRHVLCRLKKNEWENSRGIRL